MTEHYNHLNTYLKNIFGERTLKICLDGNFTCPNRDGKCGLGGCIFCSSKGSGDLINSNVSVSEQVTNYFESYRSLRAKKFIVYFQNFTNTYDTIENLKKKYDSALIDDRIVGIDIATRPDCIDCKVAKLIASYMPKYKVFVELGLQTSNNNTAKIINRGYNSSVFTKAVKILNKYNIPVICHIMVGLPNEQKAVSVDGFSVFNAVVNTVKFINKHKIAGLKIHSTYVVQDTILNSMLHSGLYRPITYNEYMENLVYIITHISPDIVIHRISADPPCDILVAPQWTTHKKWVLNGLDRILSEKHLYQGMYVI